MAKVSSGPRSPLSPAALLSLPILPVAGAFAIAVFIWTGCRIEPESGEFANLGKLGGAKVLEKAEKKP